jgi:hypothetical protein
VPATLRGDPARLRQVIANLVGNAVKFTEPAVHARERATTACCASGATRHGIDSGEIDRSSRSSRPTSRRRDGGGTGLGLSISRGLVELLGGTISAKSSLGVGSTFAFTARFEELPAPAEEPQHEAVPLAGSRVLIVDDNPTNRGILFTLARRWGMEPVPCSSADEALSVLRDNNADGARIR